MNTKSISYLALAAIAILAISPPRRIGAIPFELPPEANAPAWQTSFPYQRNIDWDFSSDPRTSSPHYEGYDDPYLYESDYVEFTGAVTWYASAPSDGAENYNGVIGIDNRSGTQVLSGTAVFRMDNWDREPADGGWIKHIWEEVDVAWSEVYDIEQKVVVPTGYDIVWQDVWESWPWQIDADRDIWRIAAWIKILPNPPWEEKVYEFTVEPGEFAFIDRLHIATECVPEPATIALLALGAAVLLIRRRT